MTDILPPAGWPNVRQLETNEFATGGANGNMNEQAKSLAARSELLKQYAALPYESKTGGYALNERVQIETGDIVRSTIPSNVNNPNVDMTGWRFDDNVVESIADLLAIPNPKDGQVAYAKSYHDGLNKGGDLFEYKSTRQLENDGGNIFNGWERKVAQSYLNPHNYGATGGGIDDDNDHFAFNRIANVVKTSNKNHFTIHIPDDDYIVGYQTFTTGTGWKYTDVLNIDFAQMTNKHVLMKSDSARIKIKDNMRYGVFHKTTGEPFETVMPWYPGTASYAQTGSIAASVGIGCTIIVGNIKTFVFSGDIDLDGNMANCVLGGKYGDTGWQVSAYGMRIGRVERFSIENIKTHDHCLDGLYIAGCNSQTTPDIFNPDYRGIVGNVQSLRNGRQGCSFTGGQNISFYDCNFADIALPTFKVQSMPKSCFDIEAEVNPIRNARFYNCFFGDAPSSSLVADNRDTKNVHFYSCRFVNSLGVTAWVRKPQFKFFNCYFNGYMEGQYATEIESDRTLYEQCEFTDDPVVNPNFKDYGRYSINSWGANPIFNDCIINLYKSGFVGNYDYAGKVIPEFNNIILNIYGTNGSCAWQGNITARIRDFRKVEDRSVFYPTFILKSGKIVIEKMDTIANKIIPYGVPYTVEDTIKSDSVVYLPKGVLVANATATDDTATKLNALIASLKNANYIA